MSKKSFDYESALQEIERIVIAIEQGNPNVDQLAKDVKHAAQLVKMCQKKLRETESTLDTIFNDMDEG